MIKNSIKNTVFSKVTLGAATALLAASIFATTASAVLLSDDFSGTSLNTNIWYKTDSGGAYDILSFGDETITISVLGASRHTNIRSKEDRFNFHQNPITVEVEIIDFPEPDPWSTASYLWDSLWFNLGAATTAANARSKPASDKGFAFALNWRPPNEEVPQNIFIGGEFNTIGNTNTLLSGVPTAIVFTVDSENYWITLVDAEFMEGEFAGTSTMTGSHGLEDYALEEYKLLIGLQSRGSDQPMISAKLGSVTVLGTFGDTDIEPTEWAGFPISEEKWVDTGDWMGSLYIGERPWVFSDRIQRWIYLPEANVAEDHRGVWMGIEPY